LSRAVADAVVRATGRQRQRAPGEAPLGHAGHSAHVPGHEAGAIGTRRIADGAAAGSAAARRPRGARAADARSPTGDAAPGLAAQAVSRVTDRPAFVLLEDGTW